MIPRSFINDLVDRADIVDVVGQRVRLKKAGGNHIGLCPFHDEKTPSFHVYADGHFHCFGCGAHGTALGFLMDYENVSFPEAVEALAALAGVAVPREASSRPTADPALYDVLAAAAERYKDWLKGEPAAIHYLKQRGVTGAVARDFGIGFAPDGWERIKTALDRFGEGKLLDAGLLAKNDSGRVYDRFRERIMFPIRETRGRVIGFGGRIFGSAGEGQPKYLNSPETDVFRKGRELYGLFEARRSGPRLDSFLVVEGYMDVVALAQHGIGNAVATLGTAIGQPHFEKLFRYADEVVCCFDGDDAGRNAAWRAVEAALPALSEGRQLKFVFLPEGEDPDTMVRDQGRERFLALMQGATPIGEYFLRRMREGLDLSQVDGRAMLRELALPAVQRLPAGSLRASLVRELADLTGSEATDLERILERIAGAASANVGRAGRAPSYSPGQQSGLAERLLRALVAQPSMLAGLASAERARLVEATVSDGLIGAVVDYLGATPDADTATLLGRFMGDAAHAELVALAERPTVLGGAALAAEFEDGVRRYLAAHARHAQRALAHDVADRASMERYLVAKRQAVAG